MRRLLAVAAFGVLGAALPAWAHHSHNAYEVTQWTEMEGTVTEIHYLLPRSWVYLEVKDPKGGAEPTIWALEATGPQGIFRNGVGKDDVKVGDKIKARCHLLRDGSPGCLLGFVTPMHGDKARGDGVEHQWD
jgi:uncharacterized protein DUF6152